MFQKTLRWYQHLNSGEKIAFWGVLVAIVFGLLTLSKKQSEVQITQSGDQATVVVGDKVEGDKVLGNKIEIHRDENATTDPINVSPEELEKALEPFDEKFFGILVAAFKGATEEQNKEGKSLQNTLVATLNARFNDLDIQHAEARAIPSSFLPYLTSHTEARKMGKKQKAELVIWGHVTLAGVIPSLTVVNPVSKASYVAQPDTTMLKDGLTHKALSDIDDIRFSALTDEPTQVTLFTIGIKYFSDGQYEKALNLLTESLPKDLDTYVHSAPIFFYLGIIHSKLHEYEKAILSYNNSLRLEPRNASTYTNLGDAYFHKGDYDKAISYYNQAIERNPELSSAYNNRGVAHINKKEYDKGMSDLAKALELDEKSPVTITNIGNMHVRRQDYENAFIYYQKALKMDPKFLLALRNRAQVYADTEKYEEAMHDVEEAFKIARDDASLFNTLGRVYHLQGEYDKAISNYLKALDLGLDSAVAYNNLGNSYVGKGEYDRAISYFDKALEIDPNNATIHYSRGTCYYDSGKHDQAISDYTRALQINPEYAEAYNGRGASHLKKTDYDKAILDFNKAIEIKPDYDKPYYNRGNAHRRQSEYYKILKSKALLSISPELAAEAYKNQGGIKRDQAIFDQAEFDYKKALEINPDNGDAYWVLAEIYRIQKKDKEAIAMYRRAIELEPRYNIGAFAPGRYYPEFQPEFRGVSKRKQPTPKQ